MVAVVPHPGPDMEEGGRPEGLLRLIVMEVGAEAPGV